MSVILAVVGLALVVSIALLWKGVRKMEALRLAIAENARLVWLAVTILQTTTDPTVLAELTAAVDASNAALKPLVEP